MMKSSSVWKNIWVRQKAKTAVHAELENTEEKVKQTSSETHSFTEHRLINTMLNVQKLEGSVTMTLSIKTDTVILVIP